MRKEKEIRLLIFEDDIISGNLSRSSRELTDKYQHLSSATSHKGCLGFKTGKNDNLVQ